MKQQIEHKSAWCLGKADKQTKGKKLGVVREEMKKQNCCFLKFVWNTELSDLRIDSSEF